MEVHASSPMASPELDEEIDVEVATSANLPWMCIVWDDPVNLMSYVTYVFQTVLGYSKSRAQEPMMQVHSEGKAGVPAGSRCEKATHRWVVGDDAASGLIPGAIFRAI